MPYVLPDLPYDYSALEPYYRAESLEIHHSKHHGAYVAGANAAHAALQEARQADDFTSLIGLEKSLAFNVSGHLLHSMFWKNLSPDGGGRPEGDLAAAINDSFGSFESFRSHLTEAAVTVPGSGWGALALEPRAGRLVVEQIYNHQDNLAHGAVPLLVFDVWEHAYYLQYRNNRADFVGSLWNLVHWADVESRLAIAEGIAVEVHS